MRISDWSSDVCSSDLLFAFVDGGDAITAEVADADSLAIDGEFADGLSASGGNLVMRALALLRARYGADRVPPLARSAERRVGKGSCSTGRCRLSTVHQKPNHIAKQQTIRQHSL